MKTEKGEAAQQPLGHWERQTWVKDEELSEAMKTTWDFMGTHTGREEAVTCAACR